MILRWIFAIVICLGLYAVLNQAPDEEEIGAPVSPFEAWGNCAGLCSNRACLDACTDKHFKKGK
jgi:hypothetical protein